MSQSKGREGKGPFQDTLPDNSAEQATLKKQDEIIDLLKNLTAKMDSDVGITDSDYAANISDDLDKVDIN